MEEDGSNIQQITHGASDSGDGGLSWSPNGEQVAYTVKTTSDPDFDSDIYIMDSDGSNPHDITNDLARNREPIWSPDGKEIIFETNRNDPSDPAHTQIYIMNADGTNARPLTDEGRSASAPVMSPDGKHIIYYSIGLTADAHAADGLYIMNADGANPILFTSKIYLDPTFSPDGTHLAVVSFDLKNGKRISNIYIVDVDGSNPVKLTSVDGDYRLLKWGR